MDREDGHSAGPLGSWFVFRAAGCERIKPANDHRRAAANKDGPPARKPVRSAILYQSFMDESRADKLGLKPVAGDLARIDSIADKAALIRTLAALQREGVTDSSVPWSPTTPRSRTSTSFTEPGGHQPARRGVLPRAQVQADPRKFVAHVAKMFELAGVADQGRGRG